MIKKKLAALLFSFAILAPAAASAEYICSSNYGYYNTSFGTAGHIRLSMYTGPSCTGSFIATKYLCTTGASSASCSSILRSESQLQAEAPMIQHAVAVDQKVLFTTSICIGGSGSCPVGVSYYAD